MHLRPGPRWARAGPPGRRPAGPCGRWRAWGSTVAGLRRGGTAAPAAPAPVRFNRPASRSTAPVMCTWPTRTSTPSAAPARGRRALTTRPALRRTSDGRVGVADKWNHLVLRLDAAGDVTAMAGAAGQDRRRRRPGRGCALLTTQPASRWSARGRWTRRTRRTACSAASTLRAACPRRLACGAAGGTAPVAPNQRAGVVVDGVWGGGEPHHLPGGELEAVAGAAGWHGSMDGRGAAARFYAPRGIAVDGAGNVYVADMFNHLVRRACGCLVAGHVPRPDWASSQHHKQSLSPLWCLLCGRVEKMICG